MNKHENIELFDYTVFNAAVDKIEIQPKYIINTLNQFSFNMAEKDAAFKKALVNSDILLPDGIGIVGAARILKNARIKKIAGSDLHMYLLHRLEEQKGSCFYLGSSEETLRLIKKVISTEFPHIRVETYSPPFKANFDVDDNEKMIKAVNEFKPDVLFVGMTAPKQEKWVDANKDNIDAKLICSIGAVFDFYSGTIKRPGKIWIKLGLEWFVRLLTEPAHVWKRYVIYGPIFVYMVFKEKLTNSFTKKQ